jgi:hypothetical protein
MNGYWPGDRKNDKKSDFSVNTMHSYDELLSTFVMRAKAADAKARVLTAGGYESEETAESKGSEFLIPLVIPEGHGVWRRKNYEKRCSRYERTSSTSSMAD